MALRPPPDPPAVASVRSALAPLDFRGVWDLQALTQGTL